MSTHEAKKLVHRCFWTAMNNKVGVDMFLMVSCAKDGKYGNEPRSMVAKESHPMSLSQRSHSLESFTTPLPRRLITKSREQPSIPSSNRESKWQLHQKRISDRAGSGKLRKSSHTSSSSPSMKHSKRNRRFLLDSRIINQSLI